MDITLELDSRYHERQEEKTHHQKKNPEASKSNSSSSIQKKEKTFQKRDKPHSSLLNKDFKLMNSEKERIIKESLCTYCGGKHSLDSCFQRPQNKLTQLSGKFHSPGKAWWSFLHSQGLNGTFSVIDTSKGEDLILGFGFLNRFNPSIDWRQGLITFNADHKDCYDPSKSISNDFFSAKSCAALVGDSRTPSFPSSVHIPSLNSHMSLMSSRDDILKEIQDFGEDNSIYSLHLFFGNMELPPSSYHDSLEDKFSIGNLQETSGLSNHSLALQISTTVSSRIIERRLLPLNEAALTQFNELKEAFTKAPILSHFDPSLPTIVETNALDYALGAILRQVSDSGKHPIAFDSCTRIPAKLSYDIYDQELLGMVWALKHWRAFLLSLSSLFEVLIDHSSLQYFMESKVLTRRQAHWAEFFLNLISLSLTALDALSCWENVYLERGEDFISNNPMNFQQLIKQDEVQPLRFFAVKVDCLSNLIESIQKELWQDPQYKSIIQELGKGKLYQDYSLDSSSQLLFFKDWVVVPKDPKIKLSILQKRHDSPLAGHPVQEKTLKLFKQDFHWSGMTQYIKDYVSSRQECSRNKNIHHKKFGLLKSLPVPNVPWMCLSMDFITQLPLSDSFDPIFVIVDKFSKMAVFIPTISSITPLDVAHVLIKNIFSKHDLP
ncbi:hypothetical protein O181_019590 [Austropuccinia psidii MF-1]|uniref:Reverse transcriptase/retrotransposon-derived protein RNase H-like domain-containing protein n=1 Tax=Austropuccinia psidii MF-1 TaxID=1389203 RepID=A0A9Q3GV78_9BASI|nr:hypothetical protein [Austropuccinia psidii MF-1]